MSIRNQEKKSAKAEKIKKEIEKQLTTEPQERSDELESAGH